MQVIFQWPIGNSFVEVLVLVQFMNSSKVLCKYVLIMSYLSTFSDF